MESMLSVVWINGKLFGIEWHFWKLVGWAGNVVFFSRFLVQWHASEKRGRVVVPAAFWWLSLAGSLLLLSYAVCYRRDSVFVFAYLFTWIPYVRNLMLHRRDAAGRGRCGGCGASTAAGARYCSECGLRLSGG
jgi:lipid-A-disaccharide synthase-like uncharacterized protein